MAEGKDEDSKMEEDWEYYDDNSVLTDFWQVPGTASSPGTSLLT